MEFNVPFQHKYGYIRDEVVAGTASGIKIIAMMDAEAVVIETSWHPDGSSRLSLLASQALNKTRNMAEFQPSSVWPGVIPGPSFLHSVGFQLSCSLHSAVSYLDLVDGVALGHLRCDLATYFLVPAYQWWHSSANLLTAN